MPSWKLARAHRLLLAKDLRGRMERAASCAEVVGRAVIAGPRRRRR